MQSEHDVRKERLKKIAAAGVDPYPANFDKKHPVADIGAKKDGAKLKTAGRLMSIREMGKLTFCHIQGFSGRAQIALRQEEVGKEEYKFFIKHFDVGDFIGVEGEVFTTKKEEKTLLVKKYQLLTKTLLPLPEKWHGIKDEELRFRKRYLDFVSNPENKELFLRKSTFWNSMREFFLKKGFIEVETPVLETTTGGADATPFMTHHNALDIDVYLRISMGELWQKRLMVAGFEKTFEIGRQFRNEGMSREHLQDYTQMEFYWAYADYEQGMALVEEMYKHVIKATYSRMKFDIAEFKSIDFSKPWPRVSFVEEIKKRHKIDVLAATEAEIRKKLDEIGTEHEKGDQKGRLMDLLWKNCRKSIAGPAFLVDQPVAVSPLAKRQPQNPELTERYQVLLAGSEMGNGYSELNDPADQRERFEEQARMRAAGDTEAQMNDTDFVEALEHGMPPTSGFGVSERLFSFLEDKPARETVLFPLVRPKEDQ